MSNARDEEMTLMDLLLLLWGQKWLILVVTAACGALAVLYAKSEQEVFQVDAVLQLETKAKGGPEALGSMAEIFQANNPAETEIEVIRSRMVLGRAAEKLKLDLMAVPYKWGRQERLMGKSAPTLQLERFDLPRVLWGKPFEVTMLGGGKYALSSKDLGGKLLEGEVGVGIDSTSNPHRIGLFISEVKAKVGDRFLISRNHPLAGIGMLRGNLGVAEVGKKTGIIGLTYTGTDPERIAEILNEIANAYVRQDVEQKSAEAEKTLTFLQEQLPEIKRNLEASEARLNQYRSLTGSVDLTEEAKLALGQQVEIQQKFFEMQQKRKEALQLFKEDHPNVLTIDSSIARLGSRIGNQERQVRRLPLQQQEVVRLMRDVQVNTELYTGLLNNSQQLKVVKAGQVGNVRVLDYAVPIYDPIRPKKKVIQTAGILAGLMLGVGLALLRRLLQSGVDDPKVIEDALSLPVYASIPHSPMQAKLRRKAGRKEPGTHLLTSVAPEDLAVEGFRSLRTTLHFSMMDATNKVLLMVGPSPGIGKSFVSANFAATLAMAGHRVLLVDADLRKGKMHQIFGMERGVGLSDVLTGKGKFSEASRATEVKGLSFVSTGLLPPNPSELLMHENFPKLLKALEPHFDYVVIDSAPVLAVTDAVILGKLAGTTLMVLKHGRHPLGEIEACQKRLAQSDVALKGAIFNDVVNRQGGGAASYDARTYQYAYKSDAKKG